MLWQEALRLRCEPHLLGSSTDNGLSELLYDDEARAVAADLARTWLEQFHSLPACTERNVIRMLLNAGKHEALRSLGRTRPLPTKEHHLIWDTVGLVVSFDDTSRRLAQTRLNRHLLDLLPPSSARLPAKLIAELRKWRMLTALRVGGLAVDNVVGVKHLAMEESTRVESVLDWLYSRHRVYLAASSSSM